MLPPRPLLLLWLAGLSGLPIAPTGPAPEFCGRLTYRTEYQNAAGEPMYYALPIETQFYVGGGSYKWYDHHQQLQELYRADTHTVYHVAKEQAVPDTSARPVPPAVQCLPATATIAGYPCESLRLLQGEVATLVFYAPALRVDPAAFSSCVAPGWYALLQATGGGLPLRAISVDAKRGLTVVKEAVAVQALPLTAADFTPEAPAR